LATAVPGIDTVNNAAPFENGADQETDQALKLRFQNYINTRARATQAAVEYAISTVQPDLTYSISENSDAAGNYHPGNFVVVVDDGTGAPTSSLLSAVYSAVDAVRPIGSTFTVIAPTVVIVTVSMTITVGTGGNKPILQGLVHDAILDYIDKLPVGSAMPYSVLAKLAWDTDPSIINVTQITLNGGTSDVPAGISNVIKAGSVAIN
jgi:phage-related baseplate assembly protein